MASANDVTDEEQRRALQRETRLVTLLEAARETKWSLYDIEGPRLYTSRDASDRLVESLAFDLKLSRLRRNDKDIVLISSGCFPPGYGEPLGDALSHNTKVTTLSLDTKDFLPLEDQNVFQATQPWRDFLATSSSVVNVRVRHNGDQVANEVVTILLETVCGSNVIQNLCLKNRPVSPREFKSLMTAPKSLQELEIHFANQRQRWTDKDKRCVTKGIKSNQNRLQRLALYVDADESDGI
jgi:hypothetical protein